MLAGRCANELGIASAERGGAGAEPGWWNQYRNTDDATCDFHGSQGVVAAHLNASILNVAKLCRLGLLGSFTEALLSPGDIGEESTLTGVLTYRNKSCNLICAGLLDLVHMAITSLFEWHPQERISMFKVVSPNGVGYRHTPQFDDRADTRRAPMCGSWVSGRLVRGTGGIFFVKLELGYLPVTAPDGTVLLKEAISSQLVSGAGTEAVNGQYMITHHASWVTYEGVHLSSFQSSAQPIVYGAAFRNEPIALTGEVHSYAAALVLLSVTVSRWMFQRSRLSAGC